MSTSLRGLLAIVVLGGLILVIVWAPWSSREPDGMPKDVFAPFEGEWEGRFTSYSIQGTFHESFKQVFRFQSVTADSQIGEVILFSPEGDTLQRDSLYHVRKGDSLYTLRLDEAGGRDFSRGYWVDGQFVWRSQDIFGRTAFAYREWVKKDVWEKNGFTRTDRGDYLLQHGRAVRR
jgi:hypothetical protein